MVPEFSFYTAFTCSNAFKGPQDAFHFGVIINEGHSFLFLWLSEAWRGQHFMWGRKILSAQKAGSSPTQRITKGKVTLRGLLILEGGSCGFSSHLLSLWLKQVEPLLVPKKVLGVVWCCPRGAFPIPHCPHIVRRQSVARVVSCSDCICGRRVRTRRWSSNSSISKKKDSAKACRHFSSLTISSLFPYYLYKFMWAKLQVVRASDTKRNMEEVDMN